MKYSELVNLVKEDKYLKTRMDVVAYLIGYQKKIDKEDFENILQLGLDGYVEV